MKTVKIVALLPMKANSERVKGKNFRTLAGKPLFQWILDALLEVDDIDLVVINTDARRILYENGLENSERVLIRDRKPDLCGDYVSMNLILADDIKSVKADTYLMTHTTNPLLSSSTIQDALNAYNDRCEGVNSLFTVNKVQSRFYRNDLSPVNHDPNQLLRTQDLEPWFEENSCLYVFTEDSFKQTNARIGETPMMYETPPLESIDIDEHTDWVMAEAIANSHQTT